MLKNPTTQAGTDALLELIQQMSLSVRDTIALLFYEKDILKFLSVAKCTISLSNAETRLKWANIASHYKISARSY
jgi:hypothetical protein